VGWRWHILRECWAATNSFGGEERQAYIWPSVPDTNSFGQCNMQGTGQHAAKAEAAICLGGTFNQPTSSVHLAMPQMLQFALVFLSRLADRDMTPEQIGVSVVKSCEVIASARPDQMQVKAATQQSHVRQDQHECREGVGEFCPGPPTWSAAQCKDLVYPRKDWDRHRTYRHAPDPIPSRRVVRQTPLIHFCARRTTGAMLLVTPINSGH
jgi:hypothetical protein